MARVLLPDIARGCAACARVAAPDEAPFKTCAACRTLTECRMTRHACAQLTHKRRQK